MDCTDASILFRLPSSNVKICPGFGHLEVAIQESSHRHVPSFLGAMGFRSVIAHPAESFKYREPRSLQVSRCCQGNNPVYRRVLDDSVTFQAGGLVCLVSDKIRTTSEVAHQLTNPPDTSCSMRLSSHCTAFVRIRNTRSHPIGVRRSAHQWQSWTP